MDRADTDKELAGTREAGYRLIDHIDLIAGTSTGGILAIALAMGKSPAQVCDFYREFGPKIFPKDPLRLRALLRLVRYKYNPKPLRMAIESVVGTRPLGEAGCGLVIPAVDVNSGNIRLFKTDHHPDPQFDTRKVSAVDAALATSAAPTFFPAHTIRGRGKFVDGGLWANCPAMVGLTEAVAYLGYDIAEIRMLSISTTSVPYALSRARNMGGIIFWAKPVIDARMRFQVEGSWSQAKSLLTRRGGAYHRIDEKTKDGMFSLDNARMVEELIGMGYSHGQYETNYAFFKNNFIAKPLAALHRSERSANLRESTEPRPPT
jgi:hypothetical protein